MNRNRSFEITKRLGSNPNHLKIILFLTLFLFLFNYSFSDDFLNSYKKGLRALNIKSYDDAIYHFTKSIKSWRKSWGRLTLSIVYNIRGIAYTEIQKYENALEDFNEAIKLNPKYEEAFNNRGIVCYNKRDYERAVEDLQKLSD
ncbi:MAG: tetratricopeptide repeat protein [Acidobacteriota bacterium]